MFSCRHGEQVNPLHFTRYAPEMGATVTVLVPILAAVVGAILGFALNWWLTKRNQQHERMVAVFNAEIEDLRTQLSLVREATYALDTFHFTLSSNYPPDMGDDSFQWEAQETADRYRRALRTTFLTTSDDFEDAWERFYEGYGEIWIDLQEVINKRLMRQEMVLPSERTEESLRRFRLASKNLEKMIRAGLANFKAGKPVYPEVIEGIRPKPPTPQDRRGK